MSVKQLVQNGTTLRTRAAVMVVGLLVMVGQAAHAALPSGLSTSIDTLETDALAAVDLILPVVITISAAFIMIKIVKRVLGKV